MDQNSTEERNQILRQMFFEYANKKGIALKLKDESRAFNEAQRIAIYRRDKGLCQLCLEEGKPEQEARVSWKEYEADHILMHTDGGRTDVDNARVLCRYHNRSRVRI